jgi:PhoH-like ATPase
MNAKRAKKAKTPTTKLFVLDTNVLMHDPLSLFRFEEHDIYVPMMTLEELDANKKGMSEVARNARQASRLLDEIVSGAEHDMAQGHRPHRTLARTGHRPPVPADRSHQRRPADFAADRQGRQPDHRRRHAPRPEVPKRPVILVSKDINMRIKARALGLEAQDYFNDKVLEDTDLLYTGTLELPPDFWDKPRQGPGILEEGQPHLLPHQGPALPRPAGQ